MVRLMVRLSQASRKVAILNTVAVLPASGADLGRQTAEYIASDSVYDDEWFASNPMQRREADTARESFGV